MLFNSIHFLVFFPVVTILYFWLPHRTRWFFLLAASCYFYMAFVPAYILILFFLILVDYFAAFWIAASQGKKRKWALSVSLVANIAILAFYKYFNFLISNIEAVTKFFGEAANLPHWDIILPIGLSFHTFQSMAYTIEVYYGRVKPERHLGIYSLYVLFYPQMVAGPIERPQNLLHEFHQEKKFDESKVISGLRLMLWGFFKKVVVADRLAILVNGVYGKPDLATGAQLLVATYFFSWQIYCDFSGYTDIARGAARVMGFDLMVNFKTPYFSKSVSEFWRRWHISLSSWFRDYLYIPLGGNRVSSVRGYFNLIFVFLVSGLWHGANWTFVVWGFVHGFYLAFAKATENIRLSLLRSFRIEPNGRLHRWISVFVVFHLATFAWIFFRAESLGHAWKIISKIGYWLLGSEGSRLESFRGLSLYGLGMADLLLAFIVVGLLELMQKLQEQNDFGELLAKRKPWQRWGYYYVVLFVLIWFGKFENQPFIYFQF